MMRSSVNVACLGIYGLISILVHQWEDEEVKEYERGFHERHRQALSDCMILDTSVKEIVILNDGHFPVHEPTEGSSYLFLIPNVTYFKKLHSLQSQIRQTTLQKQLRQCK